MILSANWPDLIRQDLFEYFNNEYTEIQKMVPLLYNIKDSKLSAEIMSSAGEYPDLTPFGGSIDYEEMYEGYIKTFTHSEQSGGLQIRSTILSDAQGAGHGFVFTEKPQAMARAVSRSREKQGSEVFNDAFVTEPTDSDAAELCASDHPRAKDSTTQSNEGTTAFSSTAVEVVRLAMRKFKNDQGDFCNVNMDTLLVPEDLHEKAYECIKSELKTDVTTNNKNFHQGRYDLAVWLRLSDTTNWFGIDSTLSKNALYWFNREPIKFFKDESSDTLSAKYIAYYRYSRGWRNWTWIYGMLVA